MLRYRTSATCPRCSSQLAEELTLLEKLRAKDLGHAVKLRRVRCQRTGCAQWYWITAGDYHRAVEILPARV